MPFVCISLWPSSKKLIDELDLMKYFGVCFEIPAAMRFCETKISKMFLFPSLGEKGLCQYYNRYVVYVANTCNQSNSSLQLIRNQDSRFLGSK